MALKSDIRADSYRENARLAQAAAGGAGLAQVRLRHEAAATVWSDLAAFEDRRSATARSAALRAAVGMPPLTVGE